jgi:hypothetical protein
MRRGESVLLTVCVGWMSVAGARLDGQTSRVDQPTGALRPPLSGYGFDVRASVEPAARSDLARPSIAARPSLRRFAPLASALVPGAGQFLLGEDRFIAYAAVEAAMWLKRRNDRADQSRQEREFRALAREVARATFSDAPPDADWEYYEEMRKFLESGEFSLADGALVPEVNPATFNGFIWQTARQHNPDMASALLEYERRAVTPEFRWSWRNAQLEWDIYKRKTDQRNAAAGRVASDLVVIGANHVLSMVDAFRSVRLRAYAPPGGGVGLGGTYRPAHMISTSRRK